MRWPFLAVILFGACAVRAVGAEFPYTAYVNSADVYVRSGPGRDYYPTDKLPKGAKVEIYRHDPGGWYAIRPPQGSFAWVSKRHLDLDSGELATVNTARAVARVGSALSDVRDVIQVRLEKGETVELIETPAADSPWCKVAPPSGEFRWIFAKFVDRQLPADLAIDDRDAADATSRDVRLTGGSDAPDEADRGPRSPVERELDAVDDELSAIIVQDISAWSFGDLERRVETLLREAQTSRERGQARMLLAKFTKFADIKNRHDALRARGTVDRRPAAAAGQLPAADVSRYDGVGRLSPVISQKAGGPQYALVDANNSVVSFITAGPGVNLRPYVDRYVGVNGQRGYLTDLARQHINVQRVTVLDVQRR